MNKFCKFHKVYVCMCILWVVCFTCSYFDAITHIYSSLDETNNAVPRACLYK